MSKTYLIDEELLERKRKHLCQLQHEFCRTDTTHTSRKSFLCIEISIAKKDLEKFEKEHPEYLI